MQLFVLSILTGSDPVTLTLHHADPTFTVENVRHVMDSVEPKVKMQIWEILILRDAFKEIQSSGKYSTDLEKETAAIYMYVNCHPWASWERLASALYRDHQITAVEKVKVYLPPRGEFYN